MDLARLLNGLLGVAVAIAVTLLGIRFILRLSAAQPVHGFVEWIYQTSGAVLAPFQGVFPQRELGSGHVLEFSTLFAILVYIAIALTVSYILAAMMVSFPESHVKGERR